VHWTSAIVLDQAGKKGGLQVGLADGRVLPLVTRIGKALRVLKSNDVIFVRVPEAQNKATTRAELRAPPTVQGAALVLENKTGEVLAMTGGFSYPLSQLNRSTQAQRQPGSAIKPLTYLAALQAGMQPNALVPDEPITLPPIGGGANAQKKDYWTPKNYEGGAWGDVTLRRGLENSRNLVTANLLKGGIEAEPAASLNRVCELALEAKIYTECIRFYPFVLGAQPVRPIDLAGFYATVANEGARPTPHTVASIEQGGRMIYQAPSDAPVQLKSADRVAFYQLKTMLAGVVERGTAIAARELAPDVAGKTGTSEDENDTWFAGFTNDITIVVWVGYDNADGTHRTLGHGNTGAGVALPIFQSIIQAAWANGVPRATLAPPSAEAKRLIADLPIDLGSGERLRKDGRSAFIEHFRLDAEGALVERKTRFAGHEDADGKAGKRRQARHGQRMEHAAARRAPVQAQNIATRCFLFFCTTGWQ
jgi:penicillin-binding protein 1A